MGSRGNIVSNGLNHGQSSKLNALPTTAILWSRIWHFTNLGQWDKIFQ